MPFICAITVLFVVHSCNAITGCIRNISLGNSDPLIYIDYIGAVVEYNPVPGPNAYTTLEENVKNYIYYIEQAKDVGVQVIVFPEYGITGLTDNNEGEYAIPVPNVGTSNFLNESFVLLRLSDAAIEHEMYVTVNLLESVNGTDNNTIYYNTNLVFAKNGTLIAKYRKMNLYDEKNLTPGNEPATFTTDFGTFAVLTCADMLFYNPSQSVLANTGVTDVIYPTAWFSSFPFFVSLEYQLGYALANKVNLLAANHNDPSKGVGGSSIIGYDGTVLRSFLTDSPSSKLIYANIKPRSNNTKDLILRGFDVFTNVSSSALLNYKNLTVFDYDLYTYKPLNLASENVTEEICQGKFCCSFNIVTLQSEVNASEVYKLVAFKGKMNSDLLHDSMGTTKFCHLVACLNQDIASCGVRPSTPYTTIFRQITVWGAWETQSEEFFRPLSLRGNLLPVYNVSYLEDKTSDTVGISFNITRPVSNVVLFGLQANGGAVIFSRAWLSFVAILVVIQRLF